MDIITKRLKAYLRKERGLLFSKPTTLKSIKEHLHALHRKQLNSNIIKYVFLKDGFCHFMLFVFNHTDSCLIVVFIR